MRARFMEMKKRIGDALNGHGFDVEETGLGRWRVGHDGTNPRNVDVGIKNEKWLCIREPLWGMPDAEDCRSYLRADPFATARGKIAVDHASGAARLCEEFPVIDGIDLSQACGEAVRGFATARTVLSDPKKAAARIERRRHDAAAETPGESQDTLEDLCADTGWKWSRHGDGHPVVGLPVPFGGCQAKLEVTSAGGYRIAVDLNRFKSPSDIVRSAIAAYLLTANDLICFARGGVDETDADLSAFLEVRFRERPSPVLFDEALCALSVGVRFCDRELRALGDGKVAHNYLCIRGWSPNGRDPSCSGGRVSVTNPGGKEVDEYVSV